MSNKTQLQTNNSKLDTLTSLAQTMKDKAAALPDAGSGGSVETCTVTIDNADGCGLYDALYTTVNGAVYEVVNSTPASFILENVICGSAMYISHGAYETTISGTGSLLTTRSYMFYKAPTVADEECVIKLIAD